MSSNAQQKEPTQPSPRAIALAEILEPLLHLQTLDPRSLEDAAQKAAPWYDGIPPSYVTIRNLRRRYIERGIHGLERKSYRNKGKSTLSPLLAQHITNYILTETQSSLKEIWLDARTYASEVLELTELPTYDQIRYIYARIPDDIKLMEPEDRKNHPDRQALDKNIVSECPNHVWKIDSVRLNIIVVDEDTRQPVRQPWLTICMDDYSSTLPGTNLEMNAPDSRSMALALRHAMLPKDDPQWCMQGIPKVLFTDNGKLFNANHLEEMCLNVQLGINMHDAFLPRGKVEMEGFFRMLDEQCISRLPGYIGSNTKERSRRIRPKLTLEELHSEIIGFVLGTYHETVYKGVKRRLRWTQAEQEGGIRQVDASNERDLDVLLKSVNRLVGHQGIRLNNRFYYDQERRIEPYIGKVVRCFFDPRDRSKVYLYEQHESDLPFICIAEEQPKNRTAPQAIAAYRKAHKHGVTKHVKPSRKRSKDDHDTVDEAK